MKVTQGDIGRAEGRTIHHILCNQQTPWPHAQHFSRQTHNKQQSKPRHRCQVSPGTTNTLPTTTIQRPPKQSLGKSRSRTHKHQSRSQQPDIAWRRLQFQQGSRKFLSRLSPSHQQLSNQYYTDTLQTDSYLYQRDEQAHSTSHQLLSATTRESVEMNRTLALLSAGGTGHLPTHKVSGYVRIMFENWNSLGIFTQSWKMDRINYLIKRHQIDIVTGCESQCNWTKVPRHRQLSDLISPGYITRGITAHNTHENFHRDQVGGTAVMGVGRLCDLISDMGRDPSGLGRWSWIKLGTGRVVTRVISAYLPRKPNKRSKGRTVW
jgi:hypothetical protein